MNTWRPSIVLSLADPAQTAFAASHAEAAGFESVWATEFVDHSATIALAAVAGRTSTITMGSASAYASGLTPLVLAAEARDLDALSDGRLILGLGTGTRRMERDWLWPGRPQPGEPGLGTGGAGAPADLDTAPEPAA